MKKINGPVKAAYIFSLLPGNIKHSITNNLPEKLLKKLNNILADLHLLKNHTKTNILKDFIVQLKSIKNKRDDTIERSIICSFSVMALLLIAAYFFALIKFRSTDKIIFFMELVLNNGGFHLILFPIVIGYIKSLTLQSAMKLIFVSKNHFIDITISLLFSFITTAIILYSVKQSPGSSYFIFAKAFTLIVSISVVPVVEELVFRYLIITRLTNKTGIIAAVIISSVLFSLVHVPENPGLFFAYFIIGTILCGIYINRKSLFPAFMTHMLSNLFLQVL